MILFFCPVVITWEPFLPNLRSYGNYGPLCWFHLELSDNCISSSYNKLFLHTIPDAVVCLVYIVKTVLILVVLCCLYCKLHMRVIGRAIPTLLILMIIEVVTMAWFILSAVPFENIVSSFSHWIPNVTVTTVTVSTVGILVGVAIYFPTYLCVRCWKSFYQHICSRRSQCPATEQNEEFEQQPAHLTKHGNVTKSKDGFLLTSHYRNFSINQPSPRN